MLERIQGFVGSEQNFRSVNLFSADPIFLFKSIDILEKSDDLNCILRRVVLARISFLFGETCKTRGNLCYNMDPRQTDRVVTKMDKA